LFDLNNCIKIQNQRFNNCKNNNSDNTFGENRGLAIELFEHLITWLERTKTRKHIREDEKHDNIITKKKTNALEVRVRRSSFSLTEMLRIVVKHISSLCQPMEDDNDGDDGEKHRVTDFNLSDVKVVRVTRTTTKSLTE